MLVQGSLPPWLRAVSDSTRTKLSESLRKSLLLRAPKNDEELWLLLAYRLGIAIARRPLCPEHSTPFQWLADAFFHRADRLLAMAAKGSGKTKGFALLHELNSEFKPGTHTSHVGSIEKQARRCWDELEQQLKDQELIGRQVDPLVWEVATDGVPLRSDIRWRNGSRVEILAGTLGQVCVPGTTSVITDRGQIRIDKIVRDRLPVRVKSWNTDEGRWEWQSVVGWHDNGPSEAYLSVRLVDRVFAGPELTATPNHQVLQPDGTKIPLGQLRSGDCLCVAGYVLSQAQEQILLGSLLGDGSIDVHGRLCVTHGMKQRDYLEWKARVFVALNPSISSKVGGWGTKGQELRTRVHPKFRELRRRWYPEGRKRVPPAALDGLEPLGLAVWLMDDGWYANQAQRGRWSGHWGIATHWMRAADRAEAEGLFERLDIRGRWLRDRRGEDQYEWHCTAEGSRRLDGLVGEYFEIGPGYWQKRWAPPEIEPGREGLVPVEIASIGLASFKAHGARHNRFDLTVDKTHNYCVASGVVIGNSGVHPNIGAMDEFELVNWEVFEHFSKALHETQASRAQMVIGSTRFRQGGPVERVIEQMGPALTVRRWCIYDTMARCEYDCHNFPGFGQCPLWSRVEVKADGSQDEVPMCHGRAHEGTGHLTADEVINAYLMSDQLSWGTIMELRRPQSRGAFYPECEDDVHYRTDVEYVPGQPVYLGYDDGFHYPSCLGAWQLRSDGFLYQFDEIYATERLVPQLCEELGDKPWLPDCERGWPDPSAYRAIQEFNQFFEARLGRPVMVWDTDNNRIQGWRAVRRRLRGPLGHATIAWKRGACLYTWQDVKGLTRKEGTEDCEKKDDHGADQSRYLVHNLDQYLGRRAAWTGTGRPEGGVQDQLEQARQEQAEGLIKDRWDQLRRQGVRDAELQVIEQRYGPERVEFARALGGLIAEQTVGGRLRRAGLVDEPYRDPELEPEPEEEEV